MRGNTKRLPMIARNTKWAENPYFRPSQTRNNEVAIQESPVPRQQEQTIFDNIPALRKPEFTVNITSVFRYWLEKQGMNVAGFNKVSGIYSGTLSRTFRGDSTATLYKIRQIAQGFGLSDEDFLAPIPATLREWSRAKFRAKEWLRKIIAADDPPDVPAPASAEPEPNEEPARIIVSSPEAYFRVVDNEKIREVVSRYMYHIRQDHPGEKKAVRCERCMSLEEAMKRILDRDGKRRY